MTEPIEVLCHNIQVQGILFHRQFFFFQKPTRLDCYTLFIRARYDCGTCMKNLDIELAASLQRMMPTSGWHEGK